MLNLRNAPRGAGAVAIILTAVALCTAGCKTTLMPTPVSYYAGNADPFASVPEAKRSTTATIFVFTDRKPSGESDPGAYFSDYRSKEGWLALATVDLAQGLSWDELHRASLQEKRSQDPVSHLQRVEELGALWVTVPPVPLGRVSDPRGTSETRRPAERFVAKVNAALDSSRQKDIFIFVHGFNTLFGDNQILAAQLHHYLGREGVFVTYAWPSRGDLLGYIADKANSIYSVRMFRLFLKYLARNTKARRIHILAHSAGAPIAVEAVRQMRMTHYYEKAEMVRERFRIGQFVLVAPDIDLDAYTNAVLDGLEEIPDRVTIYTSTRDLALDFSHFLFGFARLGEPLEALSLNEIHAARKNQRFDLIDVTAAERKEGSFLGHSYFHKDPWVSADLLLLLRYGIPASERGLRRGKKHLAWSFSKDYPQRARRIAAELAGRKEAVE